jgi:hypothetical protein
MQNKRKKTKLLLFILLKIDGVRLSSFLSRSLNLLLNKPLKPFKERILSMQKAKSIY